MKQITQNRSERTRTRTRITGNPNPSRGFCIAFCFFIYRAGTDIGVRLGLRFRVRVKVRVWGFGDGMWGWALLWFDVVMTGGRCHQQKKMIGRGADRGYGREEKQCPISWASAKTSAEQPGNPEKGMPLGIDLYAQARKALFDRCLFETEEALANSVSTLPSGLAWLLS